MLVLLAIRFVAGIVTALSPLQKRFERSSAAQRELQELTGARNPEVVAENATSTLEDYGRAPEFAGIVGWINSKPLTLEGLRGRVVLIELRFSPGVAGYAFTFG